MRQYGFSWQETGALRLWEFAALLEHMTRPAREQAAQEQLAAAYQASGQHRTPI